MLVACMHLRICTETRRYFFTIVSMNLNCKSAGKIVSHMDSCASLLCKILVTKMWCVFVNLKRLFDSKNEKFSLKSLTSFNINEIIMFILYEANQAF